jgi:hypothetical protein
MHNRSPRDAKRDSRVHSQGAPIIEQSPTVEMGGMTVVILPTPVVTISARKRSRD